jgi:Protein of unknown function (DUF1572)
MRLHDLTVSAARDEFAKHKRYAEAAFAQLRDDDFFVKLNPHQNSIYVYVKHLAGNMHSRFTDFLTTDGEKPTRDREGEFTEEVVPREQIMAMWDKGWAAVFAALDSLKEGDLEKTVFVRREPHSVILAIIRQLAHYAYHVGQIVLLAKHIKTSRGEPWNYMTIPPGGSKAFNKAKGM